MNNLNKIGVSALCGSLAAISAANAGDLTVSGGADLAWVSQEKAVVGQPIGMGSNYTFSGDGELDNGWTVDLNIQIANANAYSIAAPDKSEIIQSHKNHDSVFLMSVSNLKFKFSLNSFSIF